jgi:hypothetical protein
MSWGYKEALIKSRDATPRPGCRFRPSRFDYPPKSNLSEENAMKFLCLICAERTMEQLPKADAEKHFEDYTEFTEAIRKSGHFVGCNRLLPPRAAITIRVRQGKLSTTDGPYVETKEQLGGYCLIEAKDMNEAIQVAARIPGAWIGCVEVRPVAEDEQTLIALGFLAPDTPR